MPTIRPYQPKDHENARRILCQFGPPAARQEGPARLAQITSYCDYYTECEPQNCFVLAGEADEAVGCILCAEDYGRYYERFRRDYLPRVRALTARQRVVCWGAAWAPRFFRKNYPAHLHIDILEPWQRMGFGSRLMDTLTDHLRAKGVPGVMLIVGAENEMGIRFYDKYGFTKVTKLPGSVVMGLNLS